MATFIAGYATTPDLDLERNRIELGAFDLRGGCRLLTHHRTWDADVGRILRLRYDATGLWCEAVVDDDALAEKSTGFSVGFGVIDYTIHHKGSPSWFASVSRGTLNEISLTDRPVNPRCAITTKRPHTPTQIADYSKAVSTHLSKLAALAENARALTAALKRGPNK